VASTAKEARDFLSDFPPDIQVVALELRQAVLSTVPGVIEMVDRSSNIIGYGFGSGYADLICTIIPSQKGIKLGIVEGANLRDPDGLLEGTGKRHRYVVVRTVADASHPRLEKLLENAVGAWRVKRGPAIQTPQRRRR
jgi:hypothetical protein